MLISLNPDQYWMQTVSQDRVDNWPYFFGFLEPELNKTSIPDAVAAGRTVSSSLPKNGCRPSITPARRRPV